MIEQEKLDKLSEAFEKVTDVEDRKILMQNRKEALSYLLEMFGEWKEEGDCLPEKVYLGRSGSKYIEIKIIEK